MRETKQCKEIHNIAVRSNSNSSSGGSSGKPDTEKHDLLSCIYTPNSKTSARPAGATTTAAQDSTAATKTTVTTAATTGATTPATSTASAEIPQSLAAMLLHPAAAAAAAVIAGCGRPRLVAGCSSRALCSCSVAGVQQKQHILFEKHHPLLKIRISSRDRSNSLSSSSVSHASSSGSTRQDSSSSRTRMRAVLGSVTGAALGIFAGWQAHAIAAAAAAEEGFSGSAAAVRLCPAASLSGEQCSSRETPDGGVEIYKPAQIQGRSKHSRQ